MRSEPEIPVNGIKIIADKNRIRILKMLHERRHTITELSKKLNLSKPTVLYHVRILENAGYIRRIDNDRKWVYYELTDLGRIVLKWKKIKIVLPLIWIFATSILIVVISILTPTRKGLPVYPAGIPVLVMLTILSASIATLIMTIYILDKLIYRFINKS